MKKISQIILKILIVLIITQCINIPTSQAAGWLGDIFNIGDNFLEKGKGIAINETDLRQTSNKIFNILFIIGVVLTVIIGAVLGIKFMMGSVEEQVKVKEALIPYAVGCVIIFGAFGIWRLMIILMNNII